MIALWKVLWISIYNFFVYACLCNKTKFLLHNIVLHSIRYQKSGFSLTGTVCFPTAHRIRLLLVYWHLMAQLNSFLHRSSEKLFLSKTIFDTLKLENGRERLWPSGTSERSNPWVALPRSLAFCDIFRDVCLSLGPCLN